jgi:Protein of unknown function (DUF3365)
MSLRQCCWMLSIGSACLAALAVALAMPRGGAARADDKPGPPAAPAADPAVERAREQVKMLDDLYKNAVVSITKTYVDNQEDRPAIMITKDVFGAMKKRGWHSARLVDATGDPLNDANAPRTDFEKEAFRRIRSGQPYYDRVVGEGKDRKLLAATVVPVVMAKCAECHEDRKVGEVLGFLRYEVPIK